MRHVAQEFAWIDERLIEQEHDRIVANDSQLKDHLLLIHASFELLNITLRKHDYEGNTEALVLLRFSARAFNTSGAAIKLVRAGYFQPAFAMVRDLLELEFLTDLFRRDRAHLRKWISLDAKGRKQEFKQVRIREALDKLDGFNEKKRAQEYELFSKYAAHVDLDGFHIISPGSVTQIGPFPSKELITASFEELAKHLQMVCLHLLILLNPTNPELLKCWSRYDQSVSSWRAKYMPRQA